jgi:hypothetical protein
MKKINGESFDYGQASLYFFVTFVTKKSQNPKRSEIEKVERYLNVNCIHDTI